MKKLVGFELFAPVFSQCFAAGAFVRTGRRVGFAVFDLRSFSA